MDLYHSKINNQKFNLWIW